MVQSDVYKDVLVYSSDYSFIGPFNNTLYAFVMP